VLYFNDKLVTHTTIHNTKTNTNTAICNLPHTPPRSIHPYTIHAEMPTDHVFHESLFQRIQMLPKNVPVLWVTIFQLTLKERYCRASYQLSNQSFGGFVYRKSLGKSTNSECSTSGRCGSGFLHTCAHLRMLPLHTTSFEKTFPQPL
jgi:hypothetical protein